MEAEHNYFTMMWWHFVSSCCVYSVIFLAHFRIFTFHLNEVKVADVNSNHNDKPQLQFPEGSSAENPLQQSKLCVISGTSVKICKPGCALILIPILHSRSCKVAADWIRYLHWCSQVFRSGHLRTWQPALRRANSSKHLPFYINKSHCDQSNTKLHSSTGLPWSMLHHCLILSVLGFQLGIYPGMQC